MAVEEFEDTDEVEKKQGSIRHEFWELIRVLVISLLIVIPIRYFVAQPFVVRGASMEPTFQDGEYLIVDELTYRFHPPERGDVIILRYPRDLRKFFIKRVVGLPGETVIIEGGKIKIKSGDGGVPILLEESYLPANILTYPDDVMALGEGEFFVLGDNRGDSADSRVWGVLESNKLVGRAFLRLWPLSRVSVF
ncbi:MAG: Signal peptidase I [Parcubacteria group bacterium GW2011_GWA2_47_10b]|nr:MAG: Signal peptidase I [Parcubacteria group bacterium GW2011_GWA2_47_10b]